MIKKSIDIDEKQNEYIKKSSLNFSKWVREQINKFMEGKK